ncbi:hypothetical protein BTE48_17885, partial [Oceanospirillum multiglobuliferum]
GQVELGGTQAQVVVAEVDYHPADHQLVATVADHQLAATVADHQLAATVADHQLAATVADHQLAATVADHLLAVLAVDQGLSHDYQRSLRHLPREYH